MAGRNEEREEREKLLELSSKIHKFIVYIYQYVLYTFSKIDSIQIFLDLIFIIF